MLHAKFTDPRPFGSGGEDFQRFLLSIALRWPSWSCDLDYFYKCLFPLMLLLKLCFELSSSFRGKDV